jgi:hypothetical protein
LGGVLAVIALVVSYFAWVYPDPSNQVSSLQERHTYVAMAEAMCEEAGASLAGLSMDGTTPEEYSEQMEKAAVSYNTVLQQWAELRPPREADEQQLRPILSSLEAMVISMRTVASWMREGNLQLASDEYERLREHGRQYKDHARAYGVYGCLGLAPF